MWKYMEEGKCVEIMDKEACEEYMEVGECVEYTEGESVWEYMEEGESVEYMEEGERVGIYGGGRMRGNM